MKKFFLSTTVVVSFIIYSLIKQQSGNAAAPMALAPVPSGSSSPSPTLPPPAGTGGPPPVSDPPTAAPSGKYRDGQYTGPAADAFYGNIQVKAIIRNGRIADVQFLQYPNDRGRSIMINNYAMPQLTQEAVTAQSSKVDIVSGATDSSQAFIESLTAALQQAS